MRLLAKRRALNIPNDHFHSFMRKIRLWCEWERLRQNTFAETPKTIANFVDEPLDEPWTFRRELIDDYGWLILSECETIVRKYAKVAVQKSGRKARPEIVALWTEEFFKTILQQPLSWSSSESLEMNDNDFNNGWSPPTLPSIKSQPKSILASRRCGVFEKQCFFNSRRAIMYIDEFANAYYVEGLYLSPGGYAVAHGWIATKHRIVDPTLPNASGEYFSGLAIKGRDGIIDYLRTKKGGGFGNNPFFFAFGKHGQNSPSFSAAVNRVESMGVIVKYTS